MSKSNTVIKPRGWHLPMAQARTADVFAAKALAEAVERKKRTEARLKELGYQSYQPLMELVK